MNKLEKLGKVIGVVGKVVVGAGVGYVIGMMGTSDIETYTHELHSFGWFVENISIGSILAISGICLTKLSSKLIVLSSKKFVKVWVRNTTNNKIKTKMVEKDSNIILTPDEEIHRIGRRVHCFR